MRPAGVCPSLTPVPPTAPLPPPDSDVCAFCVSFVCICRGLESVDLGEEEEGWGAKGHKWGHVTVRGPREETKMETPDSDEEQV